MHPHTPICPQCGAPLPRQALWRTVTCAYCSAEVTHGERIVRAASFRAAYLRSRAIDDASTCMVNCDSQQYRTLLPLGYGSTARVVLGQRQSALAERVVIKLAHPGATPDRLKREWQVLQQLQELAHPGAAYFSQRLPQPVLFGLAKETNGAQAEALVLRNPAGYWGSLADVIQHHRHGIEARHAIWIWRRMLEVLGYVHEAGWIHGRLTPAHLLVQPDDHGILIIGWADAQPQTAHVTPARDLMQAAWTIRSILHGGTDEPPIGHGTPAPLAAVLKQASEDAHWCANAGAAGIDQAVKSAAHAAFGAPQFTPFSPTT
ncbi:protein kinase family protein [Duganella sp. FT3S]|uniref:Protein kinase family protein n=1 Tax=Rugamonas fusca TaxID=2758568 RepID=A0A7W2EJN7_9BURK|nr:protein kinase family protein [Rugamonas fusca]